MKFTGVLSSAIFLASLVAATPVPEDSVALEERQTASGCNYL
jgi:hypothetical protein